MNRVRGRNRAPTIMAGKYLAFLLCLAPYRPAFALAQSLRFFYDVGVKGSNSFG
ncbi:MAG: hypothetical protein PUE65_05745 [Mollicutes bacterium]|nr:hypothetical protein [Mollicutes bacterium]